MKNMEVCKAEQFPYDSVRPANDQLRGGASVSHVGDSWSLEHLLHQSTDSLRYSSPSL